ncbi:MAG: hypothetical protein H7841_08805 [Magnetospirillum sp. WYHS-4]
MRWLFFIDGIGVVVSGAFAGIALNGGFSPVGGLAAAVIFMAGLFAPFVMEYTSVGRDFGAIGGDFLQEARRPFFPGGRGQAEIFGAHDHRPGWHRLREPIGVVAMLTVVATLLIATDLSRYALHQAAVQQQRTTITNF